MRPHAAGALERKSRCLLLLCVRSGSAGSFSRAVEWQFGEPENSAVFTSVRVARQEATVVRMIRDQDGDWQALDRLPRADGEAAVISLSSLLELHPDVRDAVAMLDARGSGWQAVRDAEGAWICSPFGHE
jgi:hypothetical protein